MNPITDNLPASLDQTLADFAQSAGNIGYGDIMALGRAWYGLTGAERARIEGLAGAFVDDAAAGRDTEAIAGQLAGAVRAAGKIAPANPGFRTGDLVLYRNGNGYGLGLVKQVLDDGASVRRLGDDTTDKASFDALHRLANAHAVRSVALDGKIALLDDGRLADGWPGTEADA